MKIKRTKSGRQEIVKTDSAGNKTKSINGEFSENNKGVETPGIKMSGFLSVH